MLAKVISGGQTGADQGGLRAARAADIPTGGWGFRRDPAVYLQSLEAALIKHALPP
jgi:hypothetical protein